MLRLFRFLLFASILLSALARNAPALRRSVELLASPASFSPGAPSAPAALGMLAVASAYAVWLCGATLARWRMPALVHLAPAGALWLTVWLGPLSVRADGGGPPAERTLAAMESLSARLGQLRQPCDAGRAAEGLLGESAGASGFYSHSSPMPFRLAIASSHGAPVRDVQAGDGPGVIYLACERSGRRFWLTAVTLDRIPRGSPTLLKDGVGRVAIVEGEAL